MTISKALAKLMKKYLLSFTSANQAAYVYGRDISESKRLMLNIPYITYLVK